MPQTGINLFADPQANRLFAAANPAEAEQWRSIVSQSPHPDVYYEPEYALAAAAVEPAEAIAMVAGKPGSEFLAPLLIRSMAHENGGSKTAWKDACTPYGYGGLLPLSPQADRTQIESFFYGLRVRCREQNIVCCVIRLHPLEQQEQQEQWFAQKHSSFDFVKIHRRGSTTAISLARWDAEHDRPVRIRKGRRSDLNIARRALRVILRSGQDSGIETDIHHFQHLYQSAMDERDAGNFYRFPAEYFSKLAELGNRMAVTLAWLGDEPVGGSIFLAGRDYAHYHLAAANAAGAEHRAGTLLVVDGARWARARGCRLLHLGGGLRPGDSLENFKCSFGGDLYHCAYLVMIADPERFEQICRLPNAPWPYNLSPNLKAGENP